MTETEATVLYQNGNELGFEFLYDNNKSFVYNCCLRILKNSEDAEEAAQDTWLHLATYLVSEFKGECAFRTLAYETASHRSIDFMRKRDSQKGEFCWDKWHTLGDCCEEKGKKHSDWCPVMFRWKPEPCLLCGSDNPRRSIRPILTLEESMGPAELAELEVSSYNAPDEDLLINDMLDVLDADEKILILLKVEGYSDEELAEKYNKPVNTVKSDVFRIREKLRGQR